MAGDSTLPVGTPPAGVTTERIQTFKGDDGVHLQRVIDAATETLGRLMPPRALQYARDAQDRMRVVLDATTNLANANMGFTSPYWGNQNTYPGWNTTGAPAAMDTREPQREVSMQTFQAQRSRWTIT